MAITADQFDKILDRLPFLDGSGRRRFVAGGIILIGIAVPNWDVLQNALPLEKVQAGDIFSSPILAAGAMLLVYAIGSLADMFGEVFLVRAASGVFWALGWPSRVIRIKHKALRRVILILLAIFIVPFIALYNFLYGLIGRTHYTLELPNILSSRANMFYKGLPEKVAEGLSRPVGDDTEGALKFLIDQFQSQADRKWARRLVLRAKDVAATITALQVVLFYSIFVWASAAADLSAKKDLNLTIQQIGGLYRTAAQDFDVRYLRYSIQQNRKISYRYVIKLSQLVLHLQTLSEKESKKLGMGRKIDIEKVAELEQKFKERVITYNAELDEQKYQIAAQTALFTLSWLPFLFLYLGFFTTLRNAITAILQALAMSSPPPASDAPSET